jgi:hypothetical protein
LQKELLVRDLTQKDRLVRIVLYLCDPRRVGLTGQVVNLEANSFRKENA